MTEKSNSPYMNTVGGKNSFIIDFVVEFLCCQNKREGSNQIELIESCLIP